MSNFRSNPNPPPLLLIPKSRVTLKKRVLPKASLPQSRILKTYKPTYKPLCAPVPFFTSGRLNSVCEYGASSKEVGAQAAGVSSVAATRVSPSVSVGWIGDQNELPTFNKTSDGKTSEHFAEFTNNASCNLTDMIVETADVATQTHCQCECQCSGLGSSQKTASNQQLTREVAKLGYIIRDVATKITGQKALDIEKFFPIATLTDLQIIQNHIEKTENFQLKLDVYLKHLIPPGSTNIAFALRHLVTDEFLYHKNWDGSKKSEALKIFGFFNSTLFEAWKSPQFTKDMFVKTMRAEIKKAHDRHYQQTNNK